MHTQMDGSEYVVVRENVNLWENNKVRLKTPKKRLSCGPEPRDFMVQWEITKNYKDFRQHPVMNNELHEFSREKGIRDSER